MLWFYSIHTCIRAQLVHHKAIYIYKEECCFFFVVIICSLLRCCSFFLPQVTDVGSVNKLLERGWTLSFSQVALERRMCGDTHWVVVRRSLVAIVKAVLASSVSHGGRGQCLRTGVAVPIFKGAAVTGTQNLVKQQKMDGWMEVIECYWK